MCRSDMISSVKTCNKCGVAQCESEFYKANGGTSLFGDCKSCNRTRARDWQRAKRSADPDYARGVQMRRRYGIEISDYDALLLAQGGGCAMCGATVPGGRGKRFHVDHDHDTGAVRGLLCHGCNTGIGAFGEDVDRLLSAAAYLLATRDVLGAVAF